MGKFNMEIGAFRFDRMELAGSLGDLGTLIPLTVALVVVNGLSVTTVLLMAGIFYLGSGLYFKLPVPVQPLKVVSAIAIAFPHKITLPVMAASGIIFGASLLVLAFTGLIDWLAKYFEKPIMRGIQLGLGFILMNKGIGFIMKKSLFVGKSFPLFLAGHIPVNLIVGISGGFLTLFLLNNKKFPAAIVLISAGLLTGIFFGALDNIDFMIGPSKVHFYLPGPRDFMTALFLLVIPQMPLTLGNAVMGTADTCYALFGKGEKTKRATYRAFAASMGCMNIFTGFFGGMPMCHGSGGLAAHYRFGARTGGSNIIIGVIFVILALVFGKISISLLTILPNAVMGVLLFFAGLELALLIRDITKKDELFITLVIAGTGFATTNMGVAFFIGIIVSHIRKRQNRELI